MSQPGGPGIEGGERTLAAVHARKGADPREAVGIGTVAELADQLHAFGLLCFDKFTIEKLDELVSLAFNDLVLPQLDNRMRLGSGGRAGGERADRGGNLRHLLLLNSLGQMPASPSDPRPFPFLFKTNRLSCFVKSAIKSNMTKLRNRSRINDPVGLRNRLLDAAAGAFQSAGYGATSIHDLIRTTGVTGGALHHHFPTKKSLALAVIDERVAAEIASTWIDRVADGDTAAQGIVTVFEQVADTLDEQGSVGGCPLGNMASELALGDDDLRKTLAEHYGRWRAALTAKVETDIATGRASYAAGNAEGFADVVIALFTGALTIGKAEQSTRALRAAVRHLRGTMATDL